MDLSVLSHYYLFVVHECIENANAMMGFEIYYPKPKYLRICRKVDSWNFHVWNFLKWTASLLQDFKEKQKCGCDTIQFTVEYDPNDQEAHKRNPFLWNRNSNNITFQRRKVTLYKLIKRLQFFPETGIVTIIADYVVFSYCPF